MTFAKKSQHYRVCSMVELPISFETMSSLRSHFQRRYLAHHEFVEYGDAEREIAMSGTIDHPFLDQLGAHRSDAPEGHAERFSDLSASAGVWREARHPAKKAFLAWCHSVKPDTEEVLIEALDHGRGGVTHMCACDG